MTVHPISITRQLQLEFEDVEEARFEHEGWLTIYRVKLLGRGSCVGRQDILDFLERHRAMGTQTSMRDWEDGPQLPHLFGNLSADQLDVVEASDPTASGVAAALLQAVDYLADVECETAAPGSVRIHVSAEDLLSAEQLAECQRFTRAIFGDPNVGVEIVQRQTQPTGAPLSRLPFPLHQASREGITEPRILRLAREDEANFRESRRKGFPQVERRPAFSVMLPHDTNLLNIRSFLPLYDVVYAPLEALQGETPYGLSPIELREVVAAGRLKPVVSRSLGEYDQKFLCELTELSEVVLPRTLASSVAAGILDLNPLWRVAQHDKSLSIALFRDLRQEATQSRLPDEFSPVLSEWLRFQSDGLANFNAAALRQGAMLPMAFGPGAFIANLLKAIHGKRAPDLEAMFSGLQVSQAMALGAGCVPPRHPGYYRLYEWNAALIGGQTNSNASPAIGSLPFLAELDTLLKALALPIPDEVPLLEWIESVEEPMRLMRDALGALFRRDSKQSRDLVSQRATELEWKLAAFAQKRAQLASYADKFELVGITADTIAWLSGTSFPFAGTFIGAAIQRLAPSIWTKLSEGRHTRLATEILEGAGTLSNPSLVRLHRALETTRARQDSFE